MTTLDSEPKYEGFSSAIKEEVLRSCLDEQIDCLIDGRRTGQAAGRKRPSRFM